MEGFVKLIARAQRDVITCITGLRGTNEKHIIILYDQETQSLFAELKMVPPTRISKFYNFGWISGGWETERSNPKSPHLHLPPSLPPIHATETFCNKEAGKIRGKELQENIVNPRGVPK